MELIEQEAQFIEYKQRKRAKRLAFLEQLRADWGGQTIWYSGPVLSIGTYVPTTGKLAVVSTAGPLLFLPEPVQMVILEIDDDGWARLMVGFDRRDQPVYRYAKAEILQCYAKLVKGERTTTGRDLSWPAHLSNEMDTCDVGSFFC